MRTRGGRAVLPSPWIIVGLPDAAAPRPGLAPCKARERREGRAVRPLCYQDSGQDCRAARTTWREVSCETPAFLPDWLGDRGTGERGVEFEAAHQFCASPLSSRSVRSPLPIRPLRPYIHTPLARAATAINGHRNKSFGPGGSTRRLHPSPFMRAGFGGGEIGSTGDPKGDSFARHDTAVIGSNL